MPKGRPADPGRARRGTGNRPKPGEAKKAKPISPIAVVIPPETYPPTANVPAEVHDIWRAVVTDLGGANNMRASFLPAIEAYCLAVYTHAQAAQNIQQFGILVKGPNGTPITNPLLKVQKDAARIRLGLLEITGISLLSSLNSSLDKK